MPVQLGKVAGNGTPANRCPRLRTPRRLARELGVDIYEVKGTGPGGRISEDDVKAHAKAALTALATAAQAPPRAGHFIEPKLPDFAKWGKIERVSMRGVRRKTAEHLAESWNTIRTSRNMIAPTSPSSSSCGRASLPRPNRPAATMTVTAIALKFAPRR